MINKYDTIYNPIWKYCLLWKAFYTIYWFLSTNYRFRITKYIWEYYVKWCHNNTTTFEKLFWKRLCNIAQKFHFVLENFLKGIIFLVHTLREYIKYVLFFVLHYVKLKIRIYKREQLSWNLYFKVITREIVQYFFWF